MEFKKANEELQELKKETKLKEQKEEEKIAEYARQKDRMEGIKKAKAEQRFKDNLAIR